MTKFRFWQSQTSGTDTQDRDGFESFLSEESLSLWHLLFHKSLSAPWGMGRHQRVPILDDGRGLLASPITLEKSMSDRLLRALQEALWQSSHGFFQALSVLVYAVFGAAILALAFVVVVTLLVATALFYVPILMLHPLIEAIKTLFERVKIGNRRASALPWPLKCLLGLMIVSLLIVGFLLITACIPLIVLACALFVPAQMVFHGMRLNRLASSWGRKTILVGLIVISPLLLVCLAMVALTRYILMPLARSLGYGLAALLTMMAYTCHRFWLACRGQAQHVVSRCFLILLGCLCLVPVLQPWLAHVVVMPAWLSVNPASLPLLTQHMVLGFALACGAACLWGACHKVSRRHAGAQHAISRWQPRALAVQGMIVLLATGGWLALQATSVLSTILPHLSALSHAGLAMLGVFVLTWLISDVCQWLLAKQHELSVSHVLEPFELMSGARVGRAALMGAMLVEPQQQEKEMEDPADPYNFS